MEFNYEVEEVLHIPTGETRLIKSRCFNPLIHQKLDLSKKETKKATQKAEKAVAEAPKVAENDYSKMKMSEVRNLARELGLTVAMTDKKDELLAKIKDKQISNP